MQKTQVTEKQIIQVLRLAEGGQKVADVCRCPGYHAHPDADHAEREQVPGLSRLRR